MNETKYIEELKNNPMYGLEVCKGLESLRVGNKSDIRESQIEAYLGGNKTLSDLNKHLFSFAALLVPIIFSFVTITDIPKLLRPKSILYIELALIFFLASLLAGFLHMIVEYKFFKKWMKNEGKKLKKWSSTSFWPGLPTPNKIRDYINEYESIKKDVDSIRQDMETESSIIPLCFQGLLWFMGISFLVVAVFNVLSGLNTT